MPSHIKIILIVAAILFAIVTALFIICRILDYIDENKSESEFSFNKKAGINECISNDDIQYQIDSEVQQVIQNIENNKVTIQKVLNETNAAIETAWLNSYNRTLRVSVNLNKNIENYRNKRLKEAKFHYYTSLWFRSMIAADLTYKEYKQIEKTRIQFKKKKKTMNMAQIQLNATEKALDNLYFMYQKKLKS